MDIEKSMAIIEAILFASGKEVEIKQLMSILELSKEDVITIIENMKNEFEKQKRGIQIIKVNDCYQLCTKKEYNEYIYELFDKRNKPNLSNAALETIAIIAYNPKVTRAEIESIRGVNSDGTIYKLLEHNLIQEAGRMDAPGRPTMYEVSNEFYKMFGYSSKEELPELPRYKMDENEQIVIEDLVEKEEKTEAPMPEREDLNNN